MRIRLLVPVAMLLLAAGAAGAQVPSITLFGGAVKPTGDAGNGLNAGFIAGAALDMHMPATPFGVRAEGSYSRFGLQGLVGGGTDAHTSDLGFNLNGVMTLVSLPLIKPYVTAGPSYSRLEAPTGTGTTETQGHWGYNAGGGIDFGLGPIGMRLDVRYKHISVDGGSWTSVPMTLGFRF